jgi:hypothetical protein
MRVRACSNGKKKQREIRQVRNYFPDGAVGTGGAAMPTVQQITINSTYNTVGWALDKHADAVVVWQ